MINTTIRYRRQLNNSVNGNPRFEIYTDDGIYTTSSDIADAYGVNNIKDGTPVTITLTRAGRISTIGVTN